MRREHRFFLGIVLIGVSIGIGLTASANVSATKTAQILLRRIYLPLALQEWSMRTAPVSLFGVSETSEFALASSPPAMNLGLTGSVSGIRTSVSWSAIEPIKHVPPQFDWGSADALLLPLLQQGFSPQVLILSNPTWAANTECGPLYDPNDIANFISALGARYPQVKYWTLYNEVDLTTFSQSTVHNGGCFGEADLDNNGIPDYADYAELMRVSWRALHSANPNAKLAFGLLAYDNFDPADSPPGYPGGCCFSYSFLDQLLAYMQAHPLPAGEQYADVLGFNNYLLYDKAYWEKHFPGDGISAKVNALQTIMAKYGFAFPLLASEISGAITSPDRPGSYAEQARDLAQLYIQSAASRLEQSIWFTYVDFPASCSNAALVAARPNVARIVETQAQANPSSAKAQSEKLSDCSGWTFGILDEDLKPKPSYFAFKTAAEQIGGWTPSKVIAKGELLIYFFTKDGAEKRVYYVKDAGPRQVHIKASQAQVVDLYGKTMLLQPDATGKITLTVGMEPVYVELYP